MFTEHWFTNTFTDRWEIATCTPDNTFRHRLRLLLLSSWSYLLTAIHIYWVSACEKGKKTSWVLRIRLHWLAWGSISPKRRSSFSMYVLKWCKRHLVLWLPESSIYLSHQSLKPVDALFRVKSSQIFINMCKHIFLASGREERVHLHERLIGSRWAKPAYLLKLDHMQCSVKGSGSDFFVVNWTLWKYKN